MHELYVEKGDSSKMAANLRRGFELYPDDDRILTTLINHYLSTEQNEEALNYLNAALEKDPNNPSFYNARGVLYDLSKEYEKAEARSEEHTSELQSRPHL